ncbi:MAG: hypothetical protein ACJAR0_004602, partial [Candidatus Azotimanducaceae bacterium]
MPSAFGPTHCVLRPHKLALGIQGRKMNSASNKYLLAAALCCALAALAHVGCIVFGGDWY